MLHGLLADRSPVIFYIIYVFSQVLATGEPGHLTNRLHKSGTHPYETVFEAVHHTKNGSLILLQLLSLSNKNSLLIHSDTYMWYYTVRSSHRG